MRWVGARPEGPGGSPSSGSSSEGDGGGSGSSGADRRGGDSGRDEGGMGTRAGQGRSAGAKAGLSQSTLAGSRETKKAAVEGDGQGTGRGQVASGAYDVEKWVAGSAPLFVDGGDDCTRQEGGAGGGGSTGAPQEGRGDGSPPSRSRPGSGGSNASRESRGVVNLGDLRGMRDLADLRNFARRNEEAARGGTPPRVAVFKDDSRLPLSGRGEDPWAGCTSRRQSRSAGDEYELEEGEWRGQGPTNTQNPRFVGMGIRGGLPVGHRPAGLPYPAVLVSSCGAHINTVPVQQGPVAWVPMMGSADWHANRWMQGGPGCVGRGAYPAAGMFLEPGEGPVNGYFAQSVAPNVGSADSMLPRHLRPLAVGPRDRYCHEAAMMRQAVQLQGFQEARMAQQAQQKAQQQPQQQLHQRGLPKSKSMPQERGWARGNQGQLQEQGAHCGHGKRARHQSEAALHYEADNAVYSPGREPSGSSASTHTTSASCGKAREGRGPSQRKAKDEGPKPAHPVKPVPLTLWAIILHYISLLFSDYPAKAHRRWLRDRTPGGSSPPAASKLPAIGGKATIYDDEFSDSDFSEDDDEPIYNAGRRIAIGSYTPEGENSTSRMPPSRGLAPLKRVSRKRNGVAAEQAGRSLHEAELGFGAKRPSPDVSEMARPPRAEAERRGKGRPEGGGMAKRSQGKGTFKLGRCAWGPREGDWEAGVLKAAGKGARAGSLTAWGRANRIRLRRRRSRLARLWDELRHPLATLRRKYRRSAHKTRLMAAIDKRSSGTFSGIWDRIINEVFLWSQWAFEFASPTRVGRRRLYFTIIFPFVLLMAFSFMAGEYPLYLERKGEPVAADYDFGPYQLFRWVFHREAWRNFDSVFLVEWGARFIPRLPGHPTRWLQSLLIHENFSHLATNMMLFVILSWSLEGKYGFVRTAAVCLTSGLAGNFLSAAGEDPCALVVGASGCVFGLAGFFVVDAVFDFRHVMFPFLRLLGFLVFLVAFAASLATQSETSHLSHVGGFLTGCGLSLALLRRFFDERLEATMPWIALTTLAIMFIPFPVVVYQDILPDISCDLGT
ncbi:unnamed protein product [Ostreobium quekettii]|uniref:RHOMBOID-like protein n=1 Tax=Ostreobium quekettii TaxID=121088 RepID=A0A8S1IK88_9CHLO|nr:unnamed protein product [Ostreobium quekettii]|eukprot:evm.model.scf_944.3 EVM.evm.TU.scf_944.3   scf_944:34567-39463(-)